MSCEKLFSKFSVFKNIIDQIIPKGRIFIWISPRAPFINFQCSTIMNFYLFICKHIIWTILTFFWDFEEKKLSVKRWLFNHVTKQVHAPANFFSLIFTCIYRNSVSIYTCNCEFQYFLLLITPLFKALSRARILEIG